LIDLAQLLQVDVANQPLPFQTETISWVSLIRNIKLPLLTAMQSVCRSTQQHFNAHFVRKGSLVHIIYDLISEHIQTSVLSCAPSVVKLLLVNMIGNGTKASIRERRNSFAKESLSKAGNGVVGVDLPVQMLWADTSDLKQVGYA
jgi:hypothetical protein